MSAHGSTAVYGILSPIDCSGRPVPEVRRIFEVSGEVGLLSPEDHVVELGLLPVVGGDPDGRDVKSGCGGAQLGRCDESADEDHSVDGCSL